MKTNKQIKNQINPNYHQQYMTQGTFTWVLNFLCLVLITRSLVLSLKSVIFFSDFLVNSQSSFRMSVSLKLFFLFIQRDSSCQYDKKRKEGFAFEIFLFTKFGLIGIHIWRLKQIVYLVISQVLGWLLGSNFYLVTITNLWFCCELSKDNLQL